MQLLNLVAQPGKIGVIEHNIIGHGKSLLTAGLGGHDGFDLGCRQAVAGHNPLDLQAFRTIDHDNPVAAFAISAGLDQQGNRQDDIGRASCPAALIGQAANQRMQDRLQPFPRRRIGKNPLPHRSPIQRAIGAGNRRPELGPQRRHCRATGPRQLMGDGVGIDQHCAKLDKELGHRAFAAADATGQADNKIAHLQPTTSDFGTALPIAASRASLDEAGPVA